MNWFRFARRRPKPAAATGPHWNVPFLWSPGYRFFLKLVDRYIVSELVRPFAILIMAAVILMLTVVITGFVEMIVRNNAPIGKVGLLMLYTTPMTIVTVLPLAYMGATLLVIGRLGKDSEITALRAAGISFKRLVFPILLLSLGASALSWQVSENLVPWANTQSKVLRQEIEMLSPDGAIATNKYFRGLGTQFYHIGQINKLSHTLHDVMIYDTAAKGPKTIITAKAGHWDGTQWTLQDGIVAHFDGDRFAREETRFDRMELDVRFKIEERLDDKREPKEMSASELTDKIAERRQGGLPTKDYDVEYHFKLAQPLACFFAAFIAAPIGMRFSRFGNYAGVAISIFLIFIYFVSESIGRSLGSNGLVPPYIASWLYNIIFFIGGLILLWDVDRR